MTNLFAGAELAEAALFDESGILPVQFYQRGDGGKGAAIRRLMTAILVDAAHCYERARVAAGKTPKRRKHGFGFSVNIPIFRFPSATVCGELGVSRDRIKERLLPDKERIVAGGRPRFVRRPAIRPLKVRSQRRRVHHRASGSERRQGLAIVRE